MCDGVRAAAPYALRLCEEVQACNLQLEQTVRALFGSHQGILRGFKGDMRESDTAFARELDAMVKKYDEMTQSHLKVVLVLLFVAWAALLWFVLTDLYKYCTGPASKSVDGARGLDRRAEDTGVPPAPPQD